MIDIKFGINPTVIYFCASKSVRILQPQQSRSAAPHPAGTPQGFPHIPGLHLSPPFYHCCGSGFFFYPGSRVKKLFLNSRKYDPGFSTWILDPGSWSCFFTHPGSRIQGSKRHRIRHTAFNIVRRKIMFEALFMEQCSASRYKKSKVKSLDMFFWWAGLFTEFGLRWTSFGTEEKRRWYPICFLLYGSPKFNF